MLHTPAPQYFRYDTEWDNEDDHPGPRCAHTLTAIPPTQNHGARLILFGGATEVEGQGGLAGLTNDVHSYDVVSNKWTRLRPIGEAPSPRAAHAAAALGTMIIVQGGVDSSGRPTDDLYGLDMTNDRCKWYRVVVQGQGPGPRYGHVMDLVMQRYLVSIGGNDGRRVVSDAWVLDTSMKPYVWQRLNPEGNRPSARMYAAGCTRSDGMLLLCGGRDTSGTPLADAYGLLLHTNGQWEWTLAPGASPSPRYQHAAVFVDFRLHVTGGANRGGRGVDGEAATAVLDTSAGVWLDRKGLVRSSCLSGKRQTEQDPSFLRRCRHAAASVGARIFIYGGLRGDTLFSDFLLAENEPLQSNSSSPALSSQSASCSTSHRINQYSSTPTTNERSESPSSAGSSMDRNSAEKLASASAAAAKTASAVFLPSDGSDTEAGVRLHTRAVVVARENAGRLGGMVQLSLNQFVNESRRMAPLYTELSQPIKFTRQRSSQGLPKKIISTLLTPRNWRPPVNRSFFLDIYEVGELCDAAEQVFMHEPTVLHLKAPIKVFGDLHGQFGDLMRLFDEYGFPSPAGDIGYIDYLFLGDYVDRGQHSLETITLLLALKIQYPGNFYLIRGNHEASDVNALFGFRVECVERLGETDGTWAWKRFNQLFNYLPLAALIEKKIFCMHGGIGSSINSVEQIEKLERPIIMDVKSTVLMDLLWSDPTENDSVEGLRPNARGPGIVTFGPDRVTDFCKRNNVDIIVRGHECVMDGFERFAHGQLITVFSATNYCGTVKNAGAILVVGRDLVIVPKLIHPLPPAMHSQDAYVGSIGRDST